MDQNIIQDVTKLEKIKHQLFWASLGLNVLFINALILATVISTVNFAGFLTASFLIARLQISVSLPIGFLAASFAGCRLARCCVRLVGAPYASASISKSVAIVTVLWMPLIFKMLFILWTI